MKVLVVLRAITEARPQNEDRLKLNKVLYSYEFKLLANDLSVHLWMEVQKHLH